MPSNKNTNINRIVVNVNTNKKSKRSNRKNLNSYTTSNNSIPATHTYINNNIPQGGGTLDVDRRVSHAVENINGSIDLLEKRKKFLDAYENKLHGGDKTSYHLNRALGELQQSRIDSDGESVQSLSLPVDNLESRSRSPYHVPMQNLYQAIDRGNITLQRGTEQIDRSNMYYTPNMYDVRTGDSEHIQSAKQEKSSLLYDGENSNSANNLDDTLVYNSPDREFEDPERPTEPIYDRPEKVGDSFIEQYKSLENDEQRNVIKKLDARTSDKNTIIELANFYLVDLKDDDNRQRPFKEIKKELLERQKEH